MTKLNYILIVLVLLITAALSWKLYSYDFKPNAVNVHKFPQIIGDWTSQELAIEKIDLYSLSTDNVFSRRYTDSLKREVNLYLVYSSTNPKTTNPPEISYSGTNVSILNKGVETIQTQGESPIKSNWLIIDNEDNQKIIYYWFKVGDVNTNNYWKQQWLIALSNLFGQRRGGALVRISATLGPGKYNETLNTIKSFIYVLIPQLQLLS